MLEAIRTNLAGLRRRMRSPARSRQQTGPGTLTRLRFGASKRADFYHSLAQYVREGKQIRDVVLRMRNEIQRIKPRDVRVTFCRSVIRDLTRGDSPATSVGRWAPYTERLVMNAGETWESNEGLAVGFEEAARLATAQSQLLGSALVRLAYPAILVVLGCGVAAFLSFSFVPQLAQSRDPSKLSGTTAALYHFGVFFQSHWPLLLGVVVTVVVVLVASLPNYTGWGRETLDRFPPWNVYRAFVGAGLLLSLSSMIGAGQKFATALSEAQRGAPLYVRSWIRLMRSRVAKGQDEIDVLDCAFLEMESRIALRVAGSGEDISVVLSRLADRQLEAVSSRMTRLATFLAVLVMAFIVAGLFFAYSAIYSGAGSMGV